MSMYDKYERNPKAKAFYKTKEWKRLREYVFNRDNGLCQECLANGNIKPGDVVHHKVEILDGKRGWDLRLTESNLITWCHTCHNSHHKSKYSSIREGFLFDSEGNLVRKEG